MPVSEKMRKRELTLQREAAGAWHDLKILLALVPEDLRAVSAPAERRLETLGRALEKVGIN